MNQEQLEIFLCRVNKNMSLQNQVGPNPFERKIKMTKTALQAAMTIFPLLLAPRLILIWHRKRIAGFSWKT
jgi:hypothetical protein